MLNLTREEHETRAMLMGMEYRADIGVYFQGNRNNGTVRDAMSLKVISFDVAVARFQNERYKEPRGGKREVEDNDPPWYPHA